MSNDVNEISRVNPDVGRRATYICGIDGSSNRNVAVVDTEGRQWSVGFHWDFNTLSYEVDTTTPDPTAEYKISDTDDASDPAYFGFINRDGAWYILKQTISTKTYRYCKGASGYSSNWGNRVGLTYDYFDAVF